MSVSVENRREKIDALSNSFIENYPASLQLIIEQWGRCRVHLSPKVTNSNELKQLYLTVFNFNSAASTLGFLDLAALLKDIEKLLKRLSHEYHRDLVDGVDDIMNELIRASKADSNALLIHINPVQELNTFTSSTESLHYPEVIFGDKTINIAIIDDDLSVNMAMCKLLDNFNFNSRHFTSISVFTDYLELQSGGWVPDLILLDIVMPDSSQEAVFSFAQDMIAQHIKVICLSGLTDFDVRLDAVRAGINDYVVKPVNVTQLVSKIRKTFNLDTKETLYAMMLDDQTDVCEFYENAFITPRLSLKAFSDVRTFFRVLDNFTPDIFLLDLNMPKVTGIEVASVLRQQARFDHIPIVFLTAEDNAEVKLNVLQAGGDDVLIKGMPVKLMIQQITYRTVRGQYIRYLASRDGLTGVLNHGQIMDACVQEFSRFKRSGNNFCIVLLDLDGFKQVNDTYGHLAGDKVLFGLGQLLNRSLRGSDQVGRYGGEEFLMLLNDTQSEVIIDKLNAVRETFEFLDFKHDERHFSVTFSAGIADVENYDTMEQLISAVDNALYHAKRNGKNQIVNAKDI